jgi:steroid 5-alpha reductase family enzyme
VNYLNSKLMIISYVNAHKMLVPPLVLVLMYWFHNLGRTRCCGWVKEASYPDKRFQERLPFWIGTFFVFVPLGRYYIAPCLLISRHVSLQPWVFGFALCCYTVGIFLHYVGDAQKYYTLRLRSGLIEDGLFARTRNPNYLGETLIYISFAILSWHWLPFLVLGG